MVNRMEKAIKATLDRAVAEGEMSATKDTRAIARFLNNTVHGLVVMGKASASRAALKDVVKIALTTLD
jgi:TetR/AcrR family transcriptional repressor of nem operon